MIKVIVSIDSESLDNQGGFSCKKVVKIYFISILIYHKVIHQYIKKD